MREIRVSRTWIRIAVRVVRAARRATVAHALVFAVTALAAASLTAIPAHGSATSSKLEQEALAQARLIRTEVTAKYRRAPGRKLAVTESTSMGVVRSLTLITDWLEPSRVVAADRGIYFAICSASATCPYPSRSAAWRVRAFLPRRMAVELALRTLVQTPVNLVVVALPAARPTWVVVERDDLLASADASTMLVRLASKPAVPDPVSRGLVDRITRPRLFVPLPFLPPPDDTIYAVRLGQ